MGRLEAKLALVTGAASGIGAATARRFVEEGAHVVCADVRPDELRATVRELGDAATFQELDVRSEAAIGGALDGIGERWGKLDVLVNNAGTPIPGRLDDLPTEVWTRGIELNLTSVFLVTRAAWPMLVASGNGCVLNTASIAGLWAIPNDAPYCATKAAVVMLTRCLALDGAPQGVRANCVCPGFTETPMIQAKFEEWPDPDAARRQAAALHPIGHLATADDMANAFVYLASDEASFVTGAVLPVDGGLTSGIWGGYADQRSQGAPVARSSSA
jgi:meso-butanediol dehydrogenase/(S,S)-butanediol dehydrogenase/diacetyl reductase